MRVRNKLMTAFIIPIFLLGILSIVIQFWNKQLFKNSLEVNAAKAMLVNRIEYLEAESTRNLFTYELLLLPDERQTYENNIVELRQLLARYKQFPLTKEEQNDSLKIDILTNERIVAEKEQFEVSEQRFSNAYKGRDLLYNKIEPLMNVEWKNSLTNEKNNDVKSQILTLIDLAINKLYSTSRAYQLYSAPQLKKSIQQDINEINLQLKKLATMEHSQEGLVWLNQLQDYTSQLITLVNHNIALADKKIMLLNQVRNNGVKLKSLIHDKVEKSAMAQLSENAALINKLNTAFLFSLLFVILFSLLLSWVFASYLMRPIKTLKAAIDRIRQGKDVAINRASNDEIGDVTEAFGEMVKENKVRLTAINEQNWLKENVNQVLKAAQIEFDLKIMCNTVIGKVANILNAGCAAFYIANEDGDDKYLDLLGSYAYSQRKNLSSHFKFGESLVGQTALEGHPIIISNVPDDYLQITSGLGEQKPSAIALYPIMLEQKTLGVIEIATFTEFKEIEKQFLEQLASNLAVVIEAIKSRQATENALFQVQNQADELQAQQEELRIFNEELEKKTQGLQNSEEELKTQSEELQSINVELEEKMQAIELKNKEIERKNNALKKAQQELEDKARSLAMAGKYKTEFLSNMSHELRTPLNSLLLLAKSFARNDDGNLTAAQIEQANIIYKGGKDLLELINDILDLSKVESGKLDIQIDNMNIQDIIEDLKRQFDPIVASKGIQFETQLLTNKKVLKTDGHRLKQILRNLISNAVKFTEKGYVKLIINDAKDDAKAIIFQISDTGIGIPQEKHKEIFEAFQQAYGNTDRTYGGTGLGLTISRELARLLGGKIELQSEVGKGSTFSLILPVDNTSSAINENATSQQLHKKAEKNSTQNNLAAIGTKQTILIIEDDPELTNSLSEMAAKKGYNYLIATTGNEGLLLAEQAVPRGIILDENLIASNGNDIIEQLKALEKTKSIPIHVIKSKKKKAQKTYDGRSICFLGKAITSENLNVIFEFFSKNTTTPATMILLVEDDPVAQKAIKQAFEGKNITLKNVSTAKEAITELSSKTPIDGMILDLGLPDMDGLTLLKTLEKNGLKIPPVIVYSAKDLSKDEFNELHHYTNQIVRKEGDDSIGRLLQECTLFMHSVAADEKHQDNAKEMLYESDAALDGKKVLLVDDDMRNVYALSRILQNHNMKVITATNGQEALEKLSGNAVPDIVIMDIMMPIMDGYETMKRIRQQEQFKELPIIAVTAKAMAEDKKSCLEAGANDYITKPIDDDKLLSLMRIWLSK